MVVGIRKVDDRLRTVAAESTAHYPTDERSPGAGRGATAAAVEAADFSYTVRKTPPPRRPRRHAGTAPTTRMQLVFATRNFRIGIYYERREKTITRLRGLSYGY